MRVPDAAPDESSGSLSHESVVFDGTLVIADRTSAADGVVELTLRDPSGASLPAWEPGAHIELRLDGGRFRTYSLCGPLSDTRSWRIAVLRTVDGRGGSAFVHDQLHQGAEISVRGPRNHFPLQPAPAYRFVAGGIGITPLLPMLEAAESAGARWQLLYGGRTAASMAFTAELARYGDRVITRPQDQHGLLDMTEFLADIEPDELVYCCGPEPLIDATERCCADKPDVLNIERFSATPNQSADSEESVEVVFQRSGKTCVVPPGRSILAIAREAGVAPPSSCTEGICGTCETEVLSGSPEHRDSVLSAAERDSEETMMICVSRSRSPRLVLDL